MRRGPLSATPWGKRSSSRGLAPLFLGNASAAADFRFTNVVIEAKEPPPCVAGQLSRMVARPADTTLRPNETVRVSVDGLDTCGKPMSVTGGRWVVSPPDIVAVDGRQARALGRAGAATATLEVGDIRTTIRIAVEGPRGPSDGDRRGVIADRDACADEVGASNIGRVTDNSDRQWLAGVIRTGRRLRFTVLDRGDPVFVGMDNAESAFALQLRFTDAFGGNETWRVAFAVKHTRAGAGWTATCQITSRQKT